MHLFIGIAVLFIVRCHGCTLHDEWLCPFLDSNMCCSMSIHSSLTSVFALAYKPLHSMVRICLGNLLCLEEMIITLFYSKGLTSLWMQAILRVWLHSRSLHSLANNGTLVHLKWYLFYLVFSMTYLHYSPQDSVFILTVGIITYNKNVICNTRNVR